MTTFGLGAIARVNDPHQFKNLAVALRFFQGMGNIVVEITCFSIGTSMYPDKVTEIV